MFRTLTAKFPGTCRRCGFAFEAGTRIRYGGRGRTYHFAAECPATKPAKWDEPPPADPLDDDRGPLESFPAAA